MRDGGVSLYTVYLLPTLKFLEADFQLVVGNGLVTTILLIMVIMLLDDVIVCTEVGRKTEKWRSSASSFATPPTKCAPL